MSTGTEDTESNTGKFTGRIVVALLTVMGLWLLTPLLVRVFFDDLVERGQFGDLFGSVRALFSGLAFVGLVFAILLQSQELSLQREELRLQRAEMKASRKQLAAQAQAQVALFHATVGQLRIAADQSLIEAIKMSGQIASATQRDNRATEIEERAQTMMDRADALVMEFPSPEIFADAVN